MLFYLPGEEVTCRIVRVKKNYGLAKVLKRANDSPDRTTPPCPHFGKCGGCQVQHLTYQAQLRMKTNTVRDALKRIGGLSGPAVEECRPSPSVWGYRNKTSVPVQAGRTDKFIAGFYKPRSHDIVQLRECKVLLPELENNLLRLIPALHEIGFSGYDEKRQNNVMNFIRHCDPATLARDIKLLTEDKYNFETAHPFDMFPQTGHVECAALLVRAEQ